MEKKIAVVICNYNGGKYLLHCIESFLSTQRDDYDIFVVDNASTDNSIQSAKLLYPDLRIIQNKENLGGAGGFDIGFRTALNLGYPYIMAMDNDAYIARDTLTLLYDYMENHPDVGMAAAKVMSLERPQEIIDYEGSLDFAGGGIVMPWYGKLDCLDAERVREREFAPTTASLIRRAALLASGGMDPEYFIYLDDIEMTHRMRLAGYRLVSVGKAKAWHKSGLSQSGSVSTFKTYYFERNRLYFFSKFVPENLKDSFVDTILSEFYRKIYDLRKNGAETLAGTYCYALNDFLEGTRGKAGEGRICLCNDEELPVNGDYDEEYEKGRCCFVEENKTKFRNKIAEINERRRLNEREKLLAEIQDRRFQWYPFRNGTRILCVSDKEKSATALVWLDTRSVAYCTIDNLLENKSTVTAEQKYDYIIFCEPLRERDIVFSMLNAANELLTDDGVLLFSADNRLAVRFFCGEKTSCKGTVLDGVDKISDMSSDNKLYSRMELSNILDEAGFYHKKFYGVYPNSQFLFYLCAEDYCPKEEVRSRIFPFYNSPETVYMDEMALYQHLVDNGLFVTMANSFVVECGFKDVLSEICQVTASYDRGKCDAYMTLISKNGLVYKQPVYAEGKVKLKILLNNAEKLKKRKISIASGRVENGEYITDYIDGISGHLYLQNLLLCDVEEFKKKLDIFCNIVRQSSEIYMGSYQNILMNTELLEEAYLDMVPLNTICKNGEFIFIDQEFMQNSYPVKAVLYRVIHSLYAGKPELEKRLPVMELYDKYGLVEELWLWERMEHDFLTMLRQGDYLDCYWREHSANVFSIAENRRRMNYSAKEYKRVFEDVFKDLDNRKIVIFGSGKYAKIFLTRYAKNYSIVMAVDNSEQKWGKYICADGYENEIIKLSDEKEHLSDIELKKNHAVRVMSPSYLSQLERGDYKVIICIKNYVQVECQLKQMGILDYAIFDPSMIYDRPNRPIINDSATGGVTSKKYHIGYTAGAFDMFHTGHVNLLRRSKDMCDYLIVGVMSDEAIRNFKRKEPCISYEDRATVVAACRYVDEVVEIPYMRGNSDEAWKMYQFDVQFCGSDYIGNEGRMKEKDFLEAHGAVLEILPYTEHISSSKIREKIDKGV